MFGAFLGDKQPGLPVRLGGSDNVEGGPLRRLCKHIPVGVVFVGLVHPNCPLYVKTPLQLALAIRHKVAAHPQPQARAVALVIHVLVQPFPGSYGGLQAADFFDDLVHITWCIFVRCDLANVGVKNPCLQDVGCRSVNNNNNNNNNNFTTTNCYNNNKNSQ